MLLAKVGRSSVGTVPPQHLLGTEGLTNRNLFVPCSCLPSLPALLIAQLLAGCLRRARVSRVII